MIKKADVIWCLESSGAKFLARSFSVDPDLTTRAISINGDYIVRAMEGYAAEVNQTAIFTPGGFNIRIANSEEIEMYLKAVETYAIRQWIQAGVDFKSMLDRGITTQVKEAVAKYPEAANLIKGELVNAVGRLIDSWKK